MEVYSYLAQLGLRAVIPHRQGQKRHPGGVWSIQEFEYDPEHDRYTCRAGHSLGRKFARPSDQTTSYYAPPNVCGACEFRMQCSPSGKPRGLRRHHDRVHLEEAQRWLETDVGRDRFEQRKVYVETQFGLAKELHGLRRAQWRGRYKVQIQVWLTAAAMNLKKLVMRRGSGLGPLPGLLRNQFRCTVPHCHCRFSFASAI